MNNANEQSIDFYRKFEEIRYDVSKSTLEDIESILDHYNQGPIMVNGTYFHFQINPLDAACLNARYKELTGHDHPIFLIEQNKVLDELIKSSGKMVINGKPSIYQRLKNNLTGKGLGISILPSKKDSYIDKFEQIKYDISKATLEDITDILDHYDQESVLISGIQHHFRLNALQGASLNARYKELTGQDHPVFLKVQQQILDEQIKNGPGIRVDGNPTVYEQLKQNSIAIENHNHVLTRSVEILSNPQEASLEDINALLSHFNGQPVIINGVAHYPFNDPLSAAKLNARYKELTGQDHPIFTKQAVEIIDELMKDKDMLVSAGAYDISYFDELERIKSEITRTKDSKSVFAEERDKQRRLDSSVREQQLDTMRQIRQYAQAVQQMAPDEVQENSIGGMRM